MNNEDDIGPIVTSWDDRAVEHQVDQALAAGRTTVRLASMKLGPYNGYSGEIRVQADRKIKVAIEHGLIPPPRECSVCGETKGRIDYHAACYELATGELLWSTQIISGQRERNMFGRSVKEFCASPLVVEGDRVIAQTELGTLAALDLFTGRILWQTTYRQIDLPKTRSYHPPNRALTWDLAPPVVVGDVIVATPSDSREIVAVRLTDGSKLWEYQEEHLRQLHHDTELLKFDLLVGADQDTVYLSGLKLAALQKPGGLASGARFTERWTEGRAP